MSKVIEHLKKQRQEKRKEGDRKKASILTTLVGELETKSKQTNKELTDADAIALIKKFVKDNDQTIELSTDDVKIASLKEENDVLNEFLPKQLSEDDLMEVFNKIDITSIGEGMKYLKENYAGQYDGKTASKILKNIV